MLAHQAKSTMTFCLCGERERFTANKMVLSYIGNI